MPEQSGLVDDHELSQGFRQATRLGSDGLITGVHVLKRGLQNPGFDPHFQSPGENALRGVARLDQREEGVEAQLLEGLRSQSRDLGCGITPHDLEQIHKVFRLEGQGALGGHHPDFEGHATPADLIDEGIGFAGFGHGLSSLAHDRSWARRSRRRVGSQSA